MKRFASHYLMTSMLEIHCTPLVKVFKDSEFQLLKSKVQNILNNDTKMCLLFNSKHMFISFLYLHWKLGPMHMIRQR